MKSEPTNPADNRLPAGIDSEKVHEAVSRSGYPLEMQVGTILREKFSVQHEWSFLDTDTGALRSLDIVANRHLYEFSQQPRVRPYLNLLLECKSNELPYVFFVAEGSGPPADFPIVAGLPHDEIVITSNDDPSEYHTAFCRALDLCDEPFLTAPTRCNTLSKCERKGKDLILSGETPHNELIRPLVKSIDHFCKQEAPAETFSYFDAHLVVAVAVLDAPMVSVRLEQVAPSLTLTPWVRVLRSEAVEANHPFERRRQRVIDVVHRDYLATYIAEWVVPFADKFGAAVQRHSQEFATGKGFAAGFAANSFDNIEARLRPRNPARDNLAARLFRQIKARISNDSENPQ